MKKLLRQLKEGVLDNNPTLVQLLGMCPTLATTTSVKNAVGMGLAATAVLIFSNLFSVYVEYFGRLGNVYGSLYVLPLGMLWLYCCMSILFYGGALNRLLTEGKL